VIRCFQEAVIWQNRHAFEMGFSRLRVRTVVRRETSDSAITELVLNYAQRYCV